MLQVNLSKSGFRPSLGCICFVLAIMDHGSGSSVFVIVTPEAIVIESGAEDLDNPDGLRCAWVTLTLNMGGRETTMAK